MKELATLEIIPYSSYKELNFAEHWTIYNTLKFLKQIILLTCKNFVVTKPNKIKSNIYIYIFVSPFCGSNIIY